MKLSNVLFVLLALCCSVSNAATDATYAEGTLHIPHVVYKGNVYDVEMTFQPPNTLLLSGAEMITGSQPANPAVIVSDELGFSLSEVLVGDQPYRLDVTFDEESGEFTATGITPINTDAVFIESLQTAYYNLTNPETGNDQLVAYDVISDQHTVVKTDVILGGYNFVFSGEKVGDKVVYQSRDYGVFLDPALENEARTALDSRGQEFTYNFYFDNAFKRYDAANPSSEALIFDSSMLSQTLKDQGLNVMEGEYKLFNIVTDPDNSYVEIRAFESLADILRGESPSSLLHAPILIHLTNGNHTNAHFVTTLKDSQGKVTQVLSFYDAVHTKDAYPEGDENRQRLQLCQPDLSACQDVGSVGSNADGRFYYQTETASYIYLAKDGSSSFYAFDKANHTLTEVAGAEFPAVFDHKRHVVDTGLGHGSEVDILSDFSSLSGMRNNVSEGEDAYLAINYDLDTIDPLGQYEFLGDIHLFKHGQVVKFNGLNAVKMFDNGDGIDHGDDSDNEKAEGHINLIAVSNNRLLLEIGNYDGVSAGGECQPDENGYYCSSIQYGYLNTSTENATSMDGILHSMPGLRFFTARRIAPFVSNDRLYISLLAIEGGRGVSHQYTLHTHSLNDLAEIAQSTGRTYVTLAAKRMSGVDEGEVLIWDGETNILTNVTRNFDLGNVNNSTGSAIASTLGRTAGIPLAGIGNLFALRADPGDHEWFLMAGEADEENSLEIVDLVPFSNWIYE